MKLQRKIVKVSDITSIQRDEMFALMDFYYTNSMREVFEKDLDEKNWVLALSDAKTGTLAGFSTQKMFTHKIDETEINVVFSGDTIIKREYWGSLELSLAFGEMMLMILKDFPKRKLYWMLISKGVRTYKFLPAFFFEYYPCFNKTTPENIQKAMDDLGFLKYPNNYDATTGIIRASENAQFLKEDFHPEKEPANEQINYFYKRNPDFQKGDELLCFSEFSLENIKPFIKRALKIM